MARNLTRSLLISALAGCAVPRPAYESAVGVRYSEGVPRPFVQEQELLISGLVDDAFSYAKQGRLPDAESRLLQALYLGPGIEKIRFNLAVILDGEGRSDEALEILDDLVERNPSSIDYRFARAQAYVSLRRYEEAVVVLKELYKVTKEANNLLRAAEFARNIATVDFQAGNVGESLCYSYEAYNLVQTPEELGRHGRLMLSLGLYRTAREYLEGEIAKDRSRTRKATVMNSLALARFALGDSKAALEAESKALDFIVEDPELGAEANVIWYLIRLDLEAKGEVLPEMSEDQLAAAEEQVLQLNTGAPLSLISWPGNLRGMLDETAAKIEAEGE